MSRSIIGCLGIVALACASTAAAQSWTPQQSGTTNLLEAVWFTGVQRGFAVGDLGTSLATVDGGLVWTPFVLTGQDLQDVAFLDQGIGLIVGDNGLIFRTTDGGTTWAPAPSATGNNLRAVAFGGGGMAYAAGRDGTILRSDSNGATWGVVETGTDRYQSAAASGSMRAWIVGDGGVIRATTDGGLTWFNQTSGTGSDLKSVFFLDTQEGWAAGQNSTLLYTQNGGATWVPRNTGILVGLDGVHFVSSNEGWAAGNLGNIFHTTNGGLLWLPEPSSTANPLSDLFFVGPSRGWAVGDSGTIVFRAGAAGIAANDAPQAGAAMHLDSNRPNPFNPATTIGFSLEVGGRATLTIYDSTGRLVARPFDQVAAAGSYEVTWDGQSAEGQPQASGIYYYRLDSAAGSLVRKMVMQK